MTKREVEARAAAASHDYSIFPDTREAFIDGYLDGHAKGMEKAAVICDDYEGYLLRTRNQNDLLAGTLASRIRAFAKEGQ